MQHMRALRLRWVENGLFVCWLVGLFVCWFVCLFVLLFLFLFLFLFVCSVWNGFTMKGVLFLQLLAQSSERNAIALMSFHIFSIATRTNVLNILKLIH